MKKIEAETLLADFFDKAILKTKTMANILDKEQFHAYSFIQGTFMATAYFLRAMGYQGGDDAEMAKFIDHAYTQIAESSDYQFKAQAQTHDIYLDLLISLTSCMIALCEKQGVELPEPYIKIKNHYFERMHLPEENKTIN